MTIELLLVSAILAGCLVAAAGWDLVTYTIPNPIQIALLGSFVLFAVVSSMSTGLIAGHITAGLIGLVIGFALFALGYVGGGDAKLFACVALWFGLTDLISYALTASIFGGALTLVLLFFRKVPLPTILARHSWLLRLHDEKAGIPYGVALAAGSFAILPYTEIFRASMAA
ncbi:MAG: prepilin peptidase [Rhizomicrobium sp.]